MSQLISKGDSLVREWTIRRKLGCIFIDVISSRGYSLIDVRKRNLLSSVRELMAEGYQITDIRIEASSERKDLTVTLDLLPGTTLKGMTSSSVNKSEYTFTYVKDEAPSAAVKRTYSPQASTSAYRDPVDRDFLPDDTPSKSRRLASDDESEMEASKAGAANGKFKKPVVKKISKGVKRFLKRKAKKAEARAIKLERDVSGVETMVTNLGLSDADSRNDRPVETHMDVEPMCQPIAVVQMTPQMMEIGSAGCQSDNNLNQVAATAAPPAGTVEWSNLCTSVPYTAAEETSLVNELDRMIKDNGIPSVNPQRGFQAVQSNAAVTFAPIQSHDALLAPYVESDDDNLNLDIPVQPYNITRSEEDELLKSPAVQPPKTDDTYHILGSLQSMIDNLDDRLAKRGFVQ